MRNQHDTFRGRRGRQIHWQCWLPESAPRAIVIIAHGVAEHGGRYAHVAEALGSLGCAVYAIDHHGHGRSGGAPALIRRLADAVADLDTLVDHAAGHHPDLPVFLLGHSLGGALSLSYALKHQDKLNGLALSGPAVSLDEVPSHLLFLAKLIAFFRPAAPMYAIDSGAISRDPEEVRTYEEDPLNYRGKIPAGTVVALANFLSWLPAALPSVTLPLLVMHGAEDRLAPVSGGERVHELAGSPDKTLHLFPGFYHEIFNEPVADREQVLDTLKTWLADRIDGSEEGRASTSPDAGGHNRVAES